MKPSMAKRPYSDVSLLAGAKAAAAKRAQDLSKEGMRNHAALRQAFARLHGHQHEFVRPTTEGGMNRWIPELLHGLALNAGRQMFKQKALRLCDAFTRELSSTFFKGMGVPINLAKKETGRAKAERWWKASTWDDLVRGGSMAKGGLAPWASSWALLIADSHEDARAGGGRHSATIARPAPPVPRSGGVDIESESDDEVAPSKRVAAAPQAQVTSDDNLNLDALAERRYGKSLGSALVSMMDGFDLYKTMHVLLMEPPTLALAVSDSAKEIFALNVAVAINDTFHSVEESSTLGNPHKSYTWHQLLFTLTLFIADRGDLWPYATARLEARGGRVKVIARSVVQWSKQGVRTRTIAKRVRKSGKKALRGGPSRGSSHFEQRSTSCGVKQLLGAQGLREQFLRDGKTRSKKGGQLAKFGRVTAPRQTPKWEEDYSVLKRLSCRDAFELCLRGRVPRFYGVSGEKADWKAAISYLDKR